MTDKLTDEKLAEWNGDLHHAIAIASRAQPGWEEVWSAARISAIAEIHRLRGEIDEAVEMLERGMKEAVPDAMIFASHTEPKRYRRSLDDLRLWSAEARAFLAKLEERG